jgi:hypothetical protein
MPAMRPFVLSCALALTVAAASAASPAPVRATLETSSTKPVVETAWRYTVVVKTRDGQPLAARMRLQILRGRTVVGCWKRSEIAPCSGAQEGTWISFKGRRTGVIRWPARSAGVKRTFQAIVVAGGRSLRLRAPLTVRLP